MGPNQDVDILPGVDSGVAAGSSYCSYQGPKVRQRHE
jgi:hypothetical protein